MYKIRKDFSNFEKHSVCFARLCVKKWYRRLEQTQNNAKDGFNK